MMHSAEEAPEAGEAAVTLEEYRRLLANGGEREDVSVGSTYSGLGQN